MVIYQKENDMFLNIFYSGNKFFCYISIKDKIESIIIYYQCIILSYFYNFKYEFSSFYVIWQLKI